ncbi:hypothetical protein OBBRIDRAFT_833768 [Obba rivulosa]|uniref:DUF6534 domain-containing protein n=1 Tax=Obba rivulosa TaxID=1052685 RepID=A0A8E2DME6_9APHY|nr:hypothetical protein OBBRIDRAFT_833768 [Obba rivulosa]
MAETDLHLGDTAGSVFIGVLFATVFFSCTVAQTVFYYRRFPNDRLGLKLLVAFLGSSVLDFVTLALDIEYLWVLTVENHDSPPGLFQLPRFWIAEYFLASLIFFTVQCYFIHKIWGLLSGKLWRLPLTIGATLSAVAGLAGGVGVAGITATDTTFTSIYRHVQAPGSLQQIAGAITDIYITVSLSVIMRESRAGFKRTQMLLRKLTIYAINRGVLIVYVPALSLRNNDSAAALCNRECPVMTCRRPCRWLRKYAAVYHSSSFVWMIFHIPESKVYMNTFLAGLNFRHHLREVGPPHVGTGDSVQFVNIEDLSSLIHLPLPGSYQDPAVPAHISIRIMTEVREQVDDNAAHSTIHHEPISL